MIIAFTGYARSGKTTAAKELMNILKQSSAQPRVYYAPFTGMLKDKASTLFDLPRSVFDEDDQKDRALKVWPYQSPRDILLALSETLLPTWPDMWVRAWELYTMDKLHNNNIIIVDDLRMPQEWGLLMKLQREITTVDVIRIDRPNTKKLPLHKTEQYIETFSPDFIIDNSTYSMKELHASVRNVYLKILSAGRTIC